MQGVQLMQRENYGLREESGIETPPDIYHLNTFHNIFKPLWGCTDMQQRENLHSSQLVLFQTVP